MPRLPRAKAAQLIRVLERHGYALARSSGGHAIYRDAEGRRATVPMHVGQTLHPKLVKRVLEDAGWTVEQFILFLAE